MNVNLKRVPGDHTVGTFVTVLFTIIMILLGGRIYQVFFTSNIFGSNSAPYSDALMWFRGTLHYMHGMAFKTYRPTINLFFSSIYSAFGKVYFIPFFDVAYFFISMSLIFVFFDRQLKVYLLIFIILLFLLFNELINPLNVGQVMMDFLPFVLTISGFFYVGWALKSKNNQLPLLYLGILLIGIAAAVRGVQLIGGMMIVLTTMIFIRVRSNRLNIMLLPIIYIAPLIIDMFLQKKYGSINNGIVSFFCFYSDPNHIYTHKCKTIYKSLNISELDVMVNYLKFILTSDGFHIFYSNIKETLSNSIEVIRTKKYFAILVLSSTFHLVNAIIKNRKSKKDWYGKNDSNINGFKQKHEIYSISAMDFIRNVIHPITVLVILFLFTTYVNELLFVYIVCIYSISFYFSYHYTLISLSLYIGGLILFSMMGMPGGERILCGFEFALPFGLILFAIEESENIQYIKTTKRYSVVLFNLVIIIFLYSGNLFLTENDMLNLKENTVIKLSGDKKINRSLYYSQDGKIFYTLHDNAEVGHKQVYGNIICPKGDFNASFKKPCYIN